MLSSFKYKKIKVLFRYMTHLMGGDIDKAIETIIIADINHLLTYSRFIIPGCYVIKDNKLTKKIIIENIDLFIDKQVNERDFDRLSESDLEHIDKAIIINYNDFEKNILNKFKDNEEYNELDIIDALLKGEERNKMYQYVKGYLEVQKIINGNE